jgi:hypothetical protein
MTDNPSVSGDCLTLAERDKLRLLIEERIRCRLPVRQLSMQAHFPRPRWPAFKRTWVEEGMHETVDAVLPLRRKPPTPDELLIAGHARRYTVDDLQCVRGGEYLPPGFTNPGGTICWFNAIMHVSRSSFSSMYRRVRSSNEYVLLEFIAISGDVRSERTTHIRSDTTGTLIT